MAKPNYAFEKRQREQQKKQKKAEKAQRKADGAPQSDAPESPSHLDAAEPPAAPAPL